MMFLDVCNRKYHTHIFYTKGKYLWGGCCAHMQGALLCCCDLYSHRACPTLGAGDPSSPFFGQVQDLEWPQQDEKVRFSSVWPDWPLSTGGTNYAKLYNDVSPTSYSWQYNDQSSTLQVMNTGMK